MNTKKQMLEQMKQLHLTQEGHARELANADKTAEFNRLGKGKFYNEEKPRGPTFGSFRSGESQGSTVKEVSHESADPTEAPVLTAQRTSNIVDSSPTIKLDAQEEMLIGTLLLILRRSNRSCIRTQNGVQRGTHPAVSSIALEALRGCHAKLHGAFTLHTFPVKKEAQKIAQQIEDPFAFSERCRVIESSSDDDAAPDDQDFFGFDDGDVYS